MTISSRTPAGDPNRCAICGGMVVTDLSASLGNSVCPKCGKLLSLIRDGWGAQLGVDLRRIRLDTRLTEMGMDSLDMVSLVMEVEELFDLDISDEEAGRLLTLADLIRWIRSRQRERDEQD
jgi:acyl carrier protein